MCQFFSLVSNGDGKPLYFDAKLRKRCLKKELSYEPDSHTSIADYFGFKAEKEDKLNKYEYNPITKVLTIDQKNNPKDDSSDIDKFCKSLDFKLIVPELNLHPIVNPFKDFDTLTVTKSDLKLLKEWNSVRASVGDSVWAYISTYFDIKYEYGFSSCTKLWDKGLVPSCDGKIWRLHGKDGKIVWQGKIK